jgi:hypothetical protein
MTSGSARADYLACLRRDRPAFADQLADVDLVLAALVDGAILVRETALDHARAAYVEHLSRTYSSLDAQLGDLVAACGELFAPDLQRPAQPRRSAPAAPVQLGPMAAAARAASR